MVDSESILSTRAMCLYSQSTAGPQSCPLESPFKITARLEASAESNDLAFSYSQIHCLMGRLASASLSWVHWLVFPVYLSPKLQA